MQRSGREVRYVASPAGLVPARSGALAAIPAGGAAASGAGSDRLSRINHIVVIYQENHSLDLAPLSSRDAAVTDLSRGFHAKQAVR
jgi:hypothetical protein